MLPYLFGIISGMIFGELFHWIRKSTRETHHQRIEAPEKIKAKNTIVNIEGNGNYNVHAVGTSKYQSAFYGHSGKVTIILEHEDRNPHDSQAIRLLLEGNVIGYLSREMARAYRKAYKYPRCQCDAKIVGSQNGSFWGLRLDI